MKWPKYWSFSFSIIPSKEIPGLISFGMDWLDLLAVQVTLKSLLLHYSSKASILRRSAFNNLGYADDTTVMAESEEELKSLLMKVKVESEKVGLKLTIQKAKIKASGPITSWEIDGETVSDFIFWGAPKSLQMVTAAMKLKDAYSLEEKL